MPGVAPFLIDLPRHLTDDAEAVFTEHGLHLDTGTAVYRIAGPGYPAPAVLVAATGTNFLHLESFRHRDDAEVAATMLIDHLAVEQVVTLPVRDARGLR